MPRGGARNATPGKSYQNRTDLGGQNVVGPKPSATGKVPIQTAPNQAQGQASAQRQAQQVVPMSGAPAGMAPTQAPQPSAPLTSLFAPTANPNEPVTAGVDMGPGAGSAVLGLGQMRSKLSDSLAQMLAFDPTGEIAVLYQEALSQGN